MFNIRFNIKLKIMEKLRKDVNDSNKEIVKQLSGLFTKLSNSIDQSYYSGQKSAYEEMLIWLKNSQNKSMKFIPPKTIKNYLLEKGAKSKYILNDKKNNKDKEDNLKRTNKANFNYLYYNQTFNVDNNTDRKNHYEYNVYPTSVENAIYNNNKSSQSLNIAFNDLKDSQENFHLSLLTNSSLHNNTNNINNPFVASISNNLNDSFDEPMNSENFLTNNYFTDENLKRKK